MRTLLLLSYFLLLGILLSAQGQSNLAPLTSHITKPISGFPITLLVQQKDYSAEKIGNQIWVQFAEKTDLTPCEFWDDFNERLSIDKNIHFSELGVEEGIGGILIHRFQQEYAGIGIKGTEWRFFEKQGVIRRAIGNVVKYPPNKHIPLLSKLKIIEKVTDQLGEQRYAWKNADAERFVQVLQNDSCASTYPAPILMISHAQNDSCRRIFTMDIANWAGWKIESNRIYADAHSGQIISSSSLSKAADIPATAQTLYSDQQNILTTYNSFFGEYFLAETGRKIKTYDLKNQKDPLRATFFKNDNTTWSGDNLNQLKILSINNNWEGIGERANNGGKPDLYFVLKTVAQQEIFRSKVITNHFPTVTFSPNVKIDFSGLTTYLIEIRDDDWLGSDLIHSFSWTPSSTLSTLSSNQTSIQISVSSQPNPALDVHWGMEKTIDFFNSTFNWDSYDGKGSVIKNYVNYPDPFATLADVDRKLIFYSMGDNIELGPMVSLDVIAHEFSHLVMHTFNPGLKYENESGALDESFSDIMGVAVERYARPNNWNWTILEEVVRAPITPRYVRSLKNPNLAPDSLAGKKRPQPDTYKGTNWDTYPHVTNPKSTNDYGGVHIKSGVQNFWFYLLARDQTLPDSVVINDKMNTIAVKGIGFDKALQVVWKGYKENIFTDEPTYIDAALATYYAARDLYGINSPETRSVLQAWRAVGVFNPSSSSNCSNLTFTTTSGSFNDGSGISADYLDGESCEWLIQPQNTNSIQLNFLFFSVYSGEDTLFIYDGASANDPLIGKFTGNSTPGPVVSTGGSLFLKFITTGTHVDAGWHVQYQANTSGDCSGQNLLVAYSDTFGDGSGQNTYPSNQSCEWLIAPPGATNISFSFSSLATEAGKDSVVIYHGPTPYDSIVGVYSGNTIPASPIIVNGSQTLVRFESDYQNNYQGWELSYQAAGTPQCTGTQSLTAVTDTFGDGSDSLSYQNNLSCGWLIQPAGARSITLTFLNFELQKKSLDGQSIYDEVQVYDGPDESSPLIGSFSGTALPNPITSSGEVLFVKFSSNQEFVTAGFSAFYNSTNQGVCSGRQLLTAAIDTFEDGSGNQSYSPNAFCQWLIQPPGATSISLTFQQFDTESNFDGVIVYDGTGLSAPVLGQFSGNNLPPTLYSSTGSMLVLFVSNDTINQTGWKATYTATISPTGSLKAISGYEYWFDQNIPTWVSIPPTYDFYLNTALPTNMLEGGFHNFHIRFRDNGNLFGEPQWSSVFSTPFVKTYDQTTQQGQITKIEFWIDENHNTRNQLAINPGAEVLLLDSLFLGNIPGGAHQLHFRFQNDNNQWSSVLSEWIVKAYDVNSGTGQVVAIEYWVDKLSATSQTLNPGQEILFLDSLVLSQVTPGAHQLHFRFKNDNGKWSSVTSEWFVKTYDIPSQSGQVFIMEYWIDDAYSNRTTQSITPGSEIFFIDSLQLSNISGGAHQLHLRFQNDNQQWSSVLSEWFVKAYDVTSGTGQIIGWEYWIDDGIATFEPVNPGAEVFFIDSLGLSQIVSGAHQLHFRFKNDNGLWSSVVSEWFVKTYDQISQRGKIIQYEFWFDENHNSRSVQTVQSNQSVFFLDTNLDVSMLNPGLHTLHLRFRNDGKIWGSVFSERFYKIGIGPGIPNKIVAFRYWFDLNFASKVDSTLPNPMSPYEFSPYVDASALDTGMHTIHFQFQDSVGIWSVPTIDTFFIYRLPYAIFSFSDSTACLGDTSYFINNSINTASYLWNFGDGDTSSAVEPLHVYDSTGQFFVTLIATDSVTGKRDTLLSNQGIIISKPILQGPDDVTYCQGDSAMLQFTGASQYFWSPAVGLSDTMGDLVYAAPGQNLIYQIIGSDSFGCQDTASLTLAVAFPILQYFQDTICQGDSIMLAGVYRTATGNYFDSLQTQFGCDSVIVTQLAVTPVYTDSLLFRICAGDSIWLAGSFRKLSGFYTESLQTQYYCDSISVFELRIDPLLSSQQTFSLCMGDSVFLQGDWQKQSGIFRDTFLAATNCDSIRITQLQVLPNPQSTSIVEICTGDSLFLAGFWQKQNGIYLDTLKAANGCDSLRSTDLRIKANISTQQQYQICSGDSILLAGVYRDISGTYLDTLKAGSGCDSIIENHLLVLPNFAQQFQTNICQGDSIRIAGTWRSQTGFYQDTLQSKNGCDSIILTDLIVNPFYFVTDSTEICQGDSILLSGSWRKFSGVYIDSLQTYLGCDSILSTNLTVWASFLDSVQVSINDGDSLFVGGAWQKIYGFYTDNFFSDKGCDSVVITELMISTGINEYLKNTYSLQIFPNPFSHTINIRFQMPEKVDIEVWLFDTNGKKICKVGKGKRTTEKQQIIFIPPVGLADGVYFLQFRMGNHIFYRKVTLLR